ncbi:MAG: dockerin type I repeat-containing protein [Clostridia bacterium]|nr:dockerin type I repeat-containing protein [Clostridia bacterium]
MLRFDGNVVTVLSFSTSEGFSVTGFGPGQVYTITASGSDDGEAEVAVFRLKTAPDLSYGDHEFVESSCGSEFDPIHIYSMGDVNCDGKINSRDATLVRQHAVGIISLDEVERVYADVYPDGLINSRDVTLITQFAVLMDVTLGDRISVFFVSANRTEVLTVRSGGSLSRIPEPDEGKLWSAAEDSFVLPDFSSLTSDLIVYEFDENANEGGNDEGGENNGEGQE